MNNFNYQIIHKLGNCLTYKHREVKVSHRYPTNKSYLERLKLQINSKQLSHDNLLDLCPTVIPKNQINTHYRPKYKHTYKSQQRPIIPISLSLSQTKTQIFTKHLSENTQPSKRNQIRSQSLPNSNQYRQQHKRYTTKYTKSAFQTFFQLYRKDKSETINLIYSHRSKEGKNIITPSQPNQDSFTIISPFSKNKDKHQHLFAIADGDGLDGHIISSLLVNTIGNLLKKQLSQGYSPDKSLVKCYDEMHNMLCLKGKQISLNKSGSTLITVLIEQQSLICANTGNCYGIACFNVDKKWQTINLCEQHYPSVEKERNRIYKNGGAIIKDKILIDKRSNLQQGLKITRSFGYNSYKNIGVHHCPDVIKISLKKNQMFILIASDGLWSHICSKDIFQLVSPYYRHKKIEEACDAILKLVQERIKTSKINFTNDITFILIFI